jgi:large subunit ribosomal protein L5
MAKGMKLKERYLKEIAPNLQKDLGIKNINAVPRLSKVTVNAGLGSFYTSGTKDFSEFVANIAAITGQKPVVTKAKKAISNFKIREEMPNGVTVTLRGERMYDFIDKLVNIVFPRTRDFRGISEKSFDGKGNYSIGIKEHIVFPEINPDDIVKIHGLQACIGTTAKNNEEGLALLRALGFPFKKNPTS